MESGGVGLVKVVMVSSIRRDVAGESDGGFEIAKRVSERTPTMNQYNFIEQMSVLSTGKCQLKRDWGEGL